MSNMQSKYNKNDISGGISRTNRALLDKLNRQAQGPFTVREAAVIFGLPLKKTSRLLAFWASRGWLTRIINGIYAAVPLGASYPKERKEDPWIVAAKVFNPCYIGGWSASEHWGLTDQIFNDVIVFSSRETRRRKHEIQGTVYMVKKTDKKKFFGLKPVWKGQMKISVSDPARTIIDLLDEPYFGGGIRSVAGMLKEYFTGDLKDDRKLAEYLDKFGSGTVYKRLGYLLETLKVGSPQLVNICLNNISAGYSKLDPGLPSTGRIIRKWNLKINASLYGVVQ